MRHLSVKVFWNNQRHMYIKRVFLYFKSNGKPQNLSCSFFINSLKNFAKGIFWLITTNFYDTMTCYNYSLISRSKLSIKYMFRALKLLWNTIIGLKLVSLTFTYYIDQIIHNHKKHIYIMLISTLLCCEKYCRSRTFHQKFEKFFDFILNFSI